MVEMTLKPVQISHGIMLKTVLFPTTIKELVTSLEKRGYEINPSIPSPLPPGRFNVTGELARKGKTSVMVETGTKLIFVVDDSIQSSIERFEEIISGLIEDHEIDLNEFARYYRFTATYLFKTKKPAYETISNTIKSPILNEFSKIIGEDVSPLVLRLGGTNLRINDENWFDINIEPNFLRDDSYVINIVYRNQDRSKTKKFMETIENKLQRIIRIIEK